jgi:hypothetical protein
MKNAPLVLIALTWWILWPFAKLWTLARRLLGRPKR